MPTTLAAYPDVFAAGGIEDGETNRRVTGQCEENSG